MKAWFDHILFYTKMQPQRPAIVLVDRAITYGMLAAGIESCARQLSRLNIATGAPVAIAVKSPLRQVVLSLALHRLGIPSMTIPSMSALMGAVAAVLDDAGAAQNANTRHRIVAVTDDWFAPEPTGGPPPPPGFSDSTQACRYSLTSGTTGEPKLYRDTIASVGKRVFNNLFSGLDVSRNGMLCMLGLSTTWGFANTCATLAGGRTLYLATSSGEAIAMIELFSIDVLLASTEQVLSLAATARRTGAQLRSLQITVMAGSVPTRTLLEAGMTYLSKDILCLYGATEIGLVTRAMARDILVSPGLAGFVVPGVEVLIVDAAGQSCAPGQIGSIKIRHTEDDGEGASLPWITLGDYGWFAPDGRLYVVGRATGEATPEKKISTAIEAEHVLRLAFDYTDAAAVLQEKAGAKPLIQIGIVKNIDASAGKIEALLSERGIDATVELYGLASIPRGAGGKVNRSQLKSALEAAQPIPRGPV